MLRKCCGAYHSSTKRNLHRDPSNLFGRSYANSQFLICVMQSGSGDSDMNRRPPFT